MPLRPGGVAGVRGCRVEAEPIALTGRERVPVGDVDAAVLGALREDVLYEFGPAR